MTAQKTTTKKHIPGPWTSHSIRGAGYYVDADNGGQYVAGFIHYKSDADTISAAPDMLQALEWFTNAWNDRASEQEQGEAYKSCIEAIAKAKGKRR